MRYNCVILYVDVINNVYIVSTGRKKRRQLFLHVAAGWWQGCVFHDNDGKVPKRPGP